MPELNYLLYRMFRGDEVSKLDNLVRGYRGEQDFAQIVQQFLPPNSLYMQDFIFEMPGYVQIDGLLLTPTEIHLYEIKNYDAHCSIQNNRLYYNEHHLQHNPMIQLMRATDSFNNILIKEQIPITVHPHLILIHPYGTYETDGSSEISVLTRHQLRQHFQQVAQRSNSKWVINPNKLALILANYRIADWHDYYRDLPLDHAKLKRGIYCLHCGSYRIQAGKHNLRCEHCQQHIQKRQALNYLIHECSALTSGEILRPDILFNLSEDIFNQKWVYKILSETLPKHRRGQYHKPTATPYLPIMLDLYDRLRKN